MNRNDFELPCGRTCHSVCEIRKKMAKLEVKAGVSFQLRHLRSTFCQMSIDSGGKANAVSKVMGHGSTETTERYYGRIRDRAACSDIRRVWKEAHAQSETKCVIPSD